MRYVFVALFALGCKQPEEIKTHHDTPSDSGVPQEETTEETPPLEHCYVLVESANPDYKERGVYYRTNVRVELSEPDPTAYIVVTDSDHLEVPGTSTVDGATLVWKPDAPFLPETEYRSEIHHVCKTEEYPFTTSNVGLPLEADVAGRTYVFNAGEALWVQPVGAETVFPVLFSNTRILISPTAEPAYDALNLMATIGEFGEQAMCMPTLDVEAAWSDPYFESTATQLDVVTDGFRFSMTEFVLTGAIAPDGSRIEGGAMTAILDTRAIGEQVGAGDSPEAVCLLLGIFGIACDPCGDGEVYCIGIEVEGAEAPEVLYSVIPVTVDDVNNDRDCD